MKLATTTGDLNYCTRDQLESIKYIHASGFKYVDYSFGRDYDEKSGTYSDAPDKYCEDVNRLCDSLGVKIVQAHAPCIPLFAEDSYGSLLECIRTSALLGIPDVVVHAGYTRGMLRDDNMKRNREIFLRLADYADGQGVTLLTENYNKMVFDDTFWIDSAKDLGELIDLVDHPRLQAVFDVGHANLQPMSIRDEINILGKRLRAIHVHDNNGRFDTHRAPFMGGSTSYDALIKGLLDISYEGYFTFEAVNITDRDPAGHRKADGDKLLRLPLDLRLELEKFLYSTGKWMLSEYGIYEE